VRTGGLYERAAAILTACSRQTLLTPSHLFVALDADLTLRQSAGFTMMASEQAHKFKIPGLDDDSQFLWDGARCDGVLDSLIAAEPTQIMDSNPLFSLVLYKVISIAIVLPFKVC